MYVTWDWVLRAEHCIIFNHLSANFPGHLPFANPLNGFVILQYNVVFVFIFFSSAFLYANFFFLCYSLLSLITKNQVWNNVFDWYFFDCDNIAKNTSCSLSCLTENELKLVLNNKMWQIEYLEIWSGTLSFSLSSCACWL